jgi:phytoene dehydrogenase-like protein
VSPSGRAARYDAVVVGAGPNGLAAAVAIARTGRSVLVREGADTIGGGAKTEALTLPGFRHDVCSAVHPLGIGSPFFRQLPLHAHGLEWIHSPAPFAHPFDDGSVAVLERSVGLTARRLGADAAAYHALMDPLVRGWEPLFAEALGPLRVPRHPFLLGGFGMRSMVPTSTLARFMFRGQHARALLAGSAAHATVRLTRPPSAAFGLVLNTAGHAVGWPIPRGGSQSIADALASYLRSLGGEIVTGAPVTSLDELPPARATLLDLTARQVLRVAGNRLPAGYRGQLERFKQGLGTFKVDWALDAPIPWRSAECARTATLHLGGPLDEMVTNRETEWTGRVAERPFVILCQPTLFDPTRAPPGKHVAWGYCHVPLGSTVDMTERIEAQIERFAPGFRSRILARHSMSPADLEAHNPNLVGGDINGGEITLDQLFTRPAWRLDPYSTPVEGLYICSASTPPGGAVHGLCGWHAARSALRRL